MSKLSKRGAGKERESRVLILAAVVLFLAVNLVLSYLASAHGWYFLVTDNQYYTLSGVTDAYFDKVNPSASRVELYFCMSEEELNENPTYGRIYDTVRQFDERYDFFTVSHLDTYYDFEVLERFAKEHDVTLTSQSVIAYSPDTGASIVRELSTFYIYDTEDTTNDDMVFNGEETVASLVERVVRTEARPVALFTTGHGELSTVSMMNHVFSAGYDVETGDIASNEIPEACELIIISCPKYDFEEYADQTLVSEVSRLRAFVARGGTLLFLRSPDAGSLPRLDAFFASMGLSAEAGVIKDANASTDLSAISLLLRYDEGEGAAVIRDRARSYNTAPIVAAEVSPLVLTAGAGYTVTPLLRTHESAVHSFRGETVSTAPDGGYTVAAMSEIPVKDGSTGKAILIGASSFTGQDVMETDGYANEEFLYALIEHATGEHTPIGCGVVLLNTYPLAGMTRGTANGYLAVFAALIPLAVAVTGVFVLRRRDQK